jgi:hypothetical protein
MKDSRLAVFRGLPERVQIVRSDEHGAVHQALAPFVVFVGL